MDIEWHAFVLTEMTRLMIEPAPLRMFRGTSEFQRPLPPYELRESR